MSSKYMTFKRTLNHLTKRMVSFSGVLLVAQVSLEFLILPSLHSRFMPSCSASLVIFRVDLASLSEAFLIFNFDFQFPYVLSKDFGLFGWF